MALEELQKDVDLKLALVEESLLKVEQSRQQQHTNACKVKEEIHNAVEHQIGSLKVRERQLVRQVEVVTAHQTCLLGTQQAGLMHSRGALTATRDLLHRCCPSDSTTVAKIKLEELECLKEAEPVQYVSVELDHLRLSRAVVEFGRVRLPDTITHHPSPVIPASMEEYEEEEHDVLHKSVARAACTTDGHITVQFPKLPHNSWLVNTSQQGLPHAPPAVRGLEGRGSMSGDVTTWLSALQLGQKEGSAGSRAPSSTTSSIEIVPSHFGSEKEGCSTPSTGSCEIEDLHLLIDDKACWLSGNSARGSMNESQQHLDIAAACRANETCSSFSDCLCQDKCGAIALEKHRQSINFKVKTGHKRTFSESEICQPIVAHMSNILASDNAQWLLHKEEAGEELPRPVKRALYEAPAQQWLRSGSVWPSSQHQPLQLATHSNMWLLNTLKGRKNAASEEKEDCQKEKWIHDHDSMITTEALSEALRKVGLTAYPGCEGSCSSLSFGAGHGTNSGAVGHTWLLSGKPHTEHQQTAEMDEELKSRLNSWNKKDWLVCTSENILCKRLEHAVVPSLSDLLVTDKGIKSWLAN